MRSVEFCSRRFDFLRLHRWAWTHKLIRKPRSMAPNYIDKHLQDLLVALCGSLFKEYGIPHTTHKEHEAVYFTVHALSAWIVEVQRKTGLSLSNRLALPTSESQIIRLICKEGRVSCAATQYEDFVHDLEMLANIDKELAAGSHNVTIEAPTPFGQIVPKRRKKRAA